MFQDKLPTKRLLCATSSPPVEASVFDFFATGVVSVSALRFFGAGASSSASSPEDPSEESEASEPSLSESEEA